MKTLLITSAVSILLFSQISSEKRNMLIAQESMLDIQTSYTVVIKGWTSLATILR